MQQRSADRDFSAYNRAQRERGVRPLARRAVEASGVAGGAGGADAHGGAGAVASPERTAPPLAVELGSGAGVEARFLAENCFRVHAIDADASVEPLLDALAGSHGIAPVIADLETLEELPAADLVLSCATLPFVRREAFAPLWALIRASLQPGGVLAADLFGERDDWAGSEGTYLARTEVDALLEGLEVVELAEEERDGRSFAGPKHWHTFQVIARRPG